MNGKNHSEVPVNSNKINLFTEKKAMNRDRIVTRTAEMHNSKEKVIEKATLESCEAVKKDQTMKKTRSARSKLKTCEYNQRNTYKIINNLIDIIFLNS